MTKQTKIIIAVLVVIILVLAGYLVWNSIGNMDNGYVVNDDSLLGGDRDEYGCITSAGYSWCEPKNKCLRIWEEDCYEDVGQEIQYLLAEKYNKSADEVRVTVGKQTEMHATGGVVFGEGGPGEGGYWLAAKIDNLWQVVLDGNGSVDCDKMRQEYGFPDEILKPNFCD